jgi:hypothetical protein
MMFWPPISILSSLVGGVDIEMFLPEFTCTFTLPCKNEKSSTFLDFFPSEVFWSLGAFTLVLKYLVLRADAILFIISPSLGCDRRKTLSFFFGEKLFLLFGDADGKVLFGLELIASGAKCQLTLPFCYTASSSIEFLT